MYMHANVNRQLRRGSRSSGMPSPTWRDGLDVLGGARVPQGVSFQAGCRSSWSKPS